MTTWTGLGEGLVTMRTSTTIHIEMPDDFPVESYDAVTNRVGCYQPIHPHPWAHWAGGWNGIGYRFRTCADADRKFTISIKKPETDEERFIQEQSHFTFFVAGYSTIECLAYALYSIGAMLEPGHFHMSLPEHFRGITPRMTTDKFRNHFATSSIASSLNTLVNNPAYENWGDVRNVLAHRAQPPRTVTEHVTDSLSATSSPDATSSAAVTEWQVVGLLLDGFTTATRRVWLSSNVKSCIQAAEELVLSRFP